MQQRSIAFIGAGNMSGAIISGMVKAGYDPKHIIASNPSQGKLNALAQQHSILITNDNNEAVKHAQTIVLAVKPQIMERVCQDLANHCDLSGKLFISIAAGITQQRLRQMLGGEYALVRTMPNTPSALGKGMTGLFADDSVSLDDKVFAEQIMAKIGETIWVEQESQMDGVIAAAGSSPAYFFLFLQAMQEEAVKQGFDQLTARKMVQQAMLGAAEMVCHNPDLELSELRAQVTSKGGTTAKAIECFQDNHLNEIVAQAMRAAVTRAKEMSAQI